MSDSRSQATPARDELAETTLIDGIRATLEGWPFRKQAAVAAVEVMKSQGWSKPRTVNAPSEFEALPVGSVVLLTSRRAGHVAWQKQDGDRWCEASDWECSMTSLELWAVNLPAAVLFTPGDAA